MDGLITVAEKSRAQKQSERHVPQYHSEADARKMACSVRDMAQWCKKLPQTVNIALPFLDPVALETETKQYLMSSRVKRLYPEIILNDYHNDSIAKRK